MMDYLGHLVRSTLLHLGSFTQECNQKKNYLYGLMLHKLNIHIQSCSLVSGTCTDVMSLMEHNTCTYLQTIARTMGWSQQDCCKRNGRNIKAAQMTSLQRVQLSYYLHWKAPPYMAFDTDHLHYPYQTFMTIVMTKT